MKRSSGRPPPRRRATSERTAQAPEAHVELDAIEWLERLSGIAAAVASELEVDKLLDTIVRQICEHGPWNRSCILRIDVGTEVMEVIAQHNLGPDFHPGYRLSATGSATIESVHTRRSILIQDTRTTSYERTRDHALRVGYRALLIVPLPFEEDIVLIVYSTTPNTFRPADVAYVSALASHAAIALRNARLYERIRNQNDSLRRLMDTHANLVQMVLHGTNLTAIARNLSTMLDRPVAILDRFGKLLAAAPDAGYWDGIHIVSAQRDVAVSPSGARSLPLIVGGELLGSLVIASAGDPLTDTDHISMEQAALVAAIEMMKEKTAFEAEMRLRSDFLDDLLANHPAATLDRAAYLGCDPDLSYDVLVVDLHEPADALQAARHRRTAASVVERSLVRSHPRSMVVVHGQDVVVLLPADPGRHGLGGPARPSVVDTASSVLAELKRQLSRVDISIGIGLRAPALRMVYASYTEAYRALRAARGLGRTGEVVTAESLGVYAMLFHDDASVDIRTFTRRALGVLIEHDELRGTSYVPTLRAYFSANGNVRAAARSLNVHVNTLINRLKRIEEIASLRLDDPDTRLQTHLALKLRDLSAEFDSS